MRPEAKGGRNIFWRPHPPPLSQGLDDRPPTPFPYLKVWIREGGGGGVWIRYCNILCTGI